MNEYEQNCPPEDVDRVLSLRRAQLAEVQEAIAHLELLAELNLP